MNHWLLKSEPDVFSFEDLKKRPKKTEPWNGVRNYQVRNSMRDQMQQDAGTAPERMAQRTTAMQLRAAGMATMTNAFGALYAVLSPEQKAIADQNVGMMGHRGMGFGRRAS